MLEGSTATPLKGVGSRTHIMSSLIVLCAVLGAGAQDINCTVTQGPDWTSYWVPNVIATDCEYSWTNGSHVVANQLSEMKTLVLTQNRSLLTIHQCFEQVQYRRDCISEGISCQATCTATCSKNAGVYHNRGPVTETRWRVFILVPLLVVLLLGSFIWCVTRRCSKPGADVETQDR